MAFPRLSVSKHWSKFVCLLSQVSVLRTNGPLVTFRKPYQIQGLIYYENLLDSTLSEEFTLFEENVASAFFSQSFIPCFS